jgi:coenzyme PQQ precursor peptide PqqA
LANAAIAAEIEQSIPSDDEILLMLQLPHAHKGTLSTPSEITIGRYGWAVVVLQGQKRPRWKEKTPMAWTTPTLVEICIGLEINGYLPAEF